jgi:hypothetical protein
MSRRVTPLGVPEIPSDAYPEHRAKPPSVPTSAIPDTTQMPESMRANLLNMANARAPASVVPRSDRDYMSRFDRGWEELVLEEPLGEEPPTKPSQTSSPSRETVHEKETAPPSSLFGRRVRGTVLTPPPPPPEEPPTRQHAVVVESKPPPSSTRGSIPREEPRDEEQKHDSGDRTVFSPARAAAALNSPAQAAAAELGATRAPSVLPPPDKQASGAPASIDDLVREMRDRYSLGDYTGALVLAEGLIEDVPQNVEVKDCAENCRNILRQMYTARIGPLDRVPVVTVARDQLRWLSIDHRAGFVLSHIDGVSSLEMILDVSGMPLLDALRILCELAQQRIISFR